MDMHVADCHCFRSDRFPGHKRLAIGMTLGLMAAFMGPTLAWGQFEGWELSSSNRRKLGKIHSPLIQESSGLAASYQHPDCYWTHNDNGPHPGLFLLDTHGQLKAHLKLPAVPFRDWEDLACVPWQGRNYLVLADVGDNQARYPSCRMYVLREPEFELPADDGQPLQLSVADDVATLEFTYPQGPRDCEAVMVDVRDRKIFTISKSMDAAADKDLSVIHWIPFQTSSTQRPLQAQRVVARFDKHMVTGANISPQQDLAVIRSYTAAWVLARPKGKTWQETLETSEPLARILLPLQRQGEAICFSSDGKTLLVTSEGRNPAIWQIDLPETLERQP